MLGEITFGDVSQESILAIEPWQLVGYDRCHFFAGIGGWDLALQWAGWPADWPVWTGSCPCQPFSVAGERLGFDDERHLWPHFYKLIRELRPPTIFGEQVANKLGIEWIDQVSANMEAIGYAFAAVVIPACVIGAHHQRKRTFWVAHAGRTRRERSFIEQCFSRSAKSARAGFGHDFALARRAVAGDHSDLLLNDGISITVGRSRIHGYGNAIVPQVGAKFIQSFMETLSV